MSEPQSPVSGPPKALTWRAASIALVLVALWTLAGCFIAVGGGVITQYILLMLGFGAIMTIFLLQFPRMFLAAVVVVYGAMWSLMFYAATPEDYPRLTRGLVVSLPVLAVLAGMAVWLWRKPLRRGELVVIYACVVIAIPWCICIKAALESSVANLFEIQRRSEPQMYSWAKDMPWWGPTIATSTSGPDPRALDAVRGFVRGNGGHVPWDLWWRPVIYWTAMCVAFEAMLMGMLLLFRKRWIEHERLPFVWAYPAMQIIGNAKPDPGADLLGQPPVDRVSRLMWILFLVGMSFSLPATLLVNPTTGETLSTWTPIPWVGQEGITGGYDLSKLNLLPGVPLRLFWCPLILTLFLLFPLDILMSAVLTHVVLSMLMPGILTKMGVQLGLTKMQEFVKWGLRFGGAVGLMVWTFWYHRKGLWGYFRGLWGRPPTDAESDDEMSRHSRQWVVLTFILGLLGFLGLGIFGMVSIAPKVTEWTWDGVYYSITSPIAQMLFLTGFTLLYAFVQVRQRIEGFPGNYDNNITSHQMTSVQRDLLKDHFQLAEMGVPGVRVTATSWITHWYQWGFTGQMKSWGPHNMLLEAMKVGHEFRVHARTIAKAVLVTMLLVAFITPVLYLTLMYTYGFDNSYQGELETWNSPTQWSARAASYGIRSTSRVFVNQTDSFYDTYHNIFNAVYGMLIIGGLMYLRREYPRFPLSPVGVIIGAEVSGDGQMPFSPEIVWFSYLIAWVAKSLIFRWLGVRSFREKVQPAVIMLLCGIIFGITLYVFRQISLGAGALK
ncbi:MAG: DUF6785 family protein [Phycisphaerae bacterium]